jgi:4-hydroxybutyrate dehydrogenase
MALINYLTRVHFGDGVLQEAIHAEIERCALKHPFILLENRDELTELEEFTLSAINNSYIEKTIAHAQLFPEENRLKRSADLYKSNGCDAIIAIGGSQVMHYAKLVRLCIGSDKSIERFSEFTGGQRLFKQSNMPLFIAAPNLFGIAPCISKYSRVLLKDGKYDSFASCRLRADIAICDPLFSLKDTSTDISASAAEALVLCLEAYFSSGFNPPADGIAIDGLRRIINRADQLGNGNCDLDCRRELMIANLSGVLALEKGRGACSVITDFLMTREGNNLSEGQIKRAVMSKVLSKPSQEISEKLNELKSIFQLDLEAAGYFEALFHKLGMFGEFSKNGQNFDPSFDFQPINEHAHAHFYALPKEYNTLLKSLGTVQVH